LDYSTVEGSAVAHGIFYDTICLEGLQKTTMNLSKESTFPNQKMGTGPPRYKAGMVIIQLFQYELVEERLT
jgi:hypothetical protein